jgi:cytochrome P450
MSPPSDKPIRLAVRALRADLLGIQKRLAQEHQGFVRYRVQRRVFTLLADAEANHQVFIGNLATYRRSLQHENLTLVIGRGLICSEGTEWRRQRKLTQPAFDGALLARVVGITSRLMTEVLANWDRARERGEPVEVFTDMQNLAMRVIGSALFSRDLEATANYFAETVRVGLEVIIRRNISPVILPLWVPTRLHRRLRHHLAAVDRFVYDRIDERLADRDGYHDILSSLIRSYGEQATHLKRELRDQVVTLFFAGFETTGTALAWTWLLLAQNEAAERRFHQELASILGGRAPTYEDLASLSYTHQIIQESMRMYPPVYTLSRKAAADDDVCGHQIRQGDNLVIPIHALHRMADYWEEPDDFRPERFAPDRLTRAQRKAYLPFAAGQRKCIGANLAITEMLTVLAVAGQRVRLRLVDGHPIVLAAAVTQHPRHGLKMWAQPRDQP